MVSGRSRVFLFEGADGLLNVRLGRVEFQRFFQGAQGLGPVPQPQVAIPAEVEEYGVEPIMGDPLFDDLQAFFSFPFSIVSAGHKDKHFVPGRFGLAEEWKEKRLHSRIIL